MASEEHERKRVKRSKKDGGFVYSSEHGRMCPSCNEPVSRCACRQKKSASAGAGGDGVVRLARSTKGRKGKGVTVITGVPLDAGDLKDLAKQLKGQCGSGGTVKDGVIEIQGEHRDRLRDVLKKMGYTVKG